MILMRMFLFVLTIKLRIFNCAEYSPLICVHGSDVLLNGTVQVHGSLRTTEGYEYPYGTWRNVNGTFEVCKCIVRPCFRKCCEEGQGVTRLKHSTCVNVTEDQYDVSRLRPTVYTENDLTPVINGTNYSMFYDYFDVLHGVPCASGRLIPEPDELDQFQLLENGKLRAWDGDEMYDVFHHCFEVALDIKEVVPVMCFVKTSEPVKFTVNSIGMLVSAPFLAATFVIYALLPSLHSVHGRSIISHVLALFTGNISIVIATFFASELTKEFCTMFAFIIYFAFLASFFWLNVMCLDIWWTFSGFRPMRGSVKEREHKKFIIYSLYCWGSPLIMLIICMVMDLHPGIPDSFEKPGFGELKCWFRSNLANFFYFSGPIAVLIVCNIILFILTAVKIRQVKRGTKILKKQDSRRHNEEEENNTQRFNLYLKLFLVMGVNWIMEIVSFAAGGPDEYWYITDIANTLQGLLIFIIFVWKDRIRKLLVERFCPSRAANSNSLGNSSSTRTTAIRHNGSVMSSGRPSFRNNKEDYPMKTLTSGRSDDSDVA